jgi:carboxypeptidase family protein
MRKSGSPRPLLLFAALILTGSIAFLHPTAAFAQATSGDVVGTVTDPSGAAVAHASVTATNNATGVSNTSQANERGEFRISNLPSGRYTIKGSAPGFSTFALQDFSVTLNQTATAQLKLPLASASTRVEVSSEAATAIDTTTIQLQQTISMKESQDLPVATVGLGAINLSLLARVLRRAAASAPVLDRRWVDSGRATTTSPLKALTITTRA